MTYSVAASLFRNLLCIGCQRKYLSQILAQSFVSPYFEKVDLVMIQYTYVYVCCTLKVAKEYDTKRSIFYLYYLLAKYIGNITLSFFRWVIFMIVFKYLIQYCFIWNLSDSALVEGLLNYWNSELLRPCDCQCYMALAVMRSKYSNRYHPVSARSHSHSARSHRQFG